MSIVPIPLKLVRASLPLQQYHQHEQFHQRRSQQWPIWHAEYD